MDTNLPKRELAPGFYITPILNGLWQTAGGHGRLEKNSAIAGMKELYDAGFTTYDGADHYGPAEDLMGHLWQTLGESASPSSVQMFTKWCPSPTDTMSRDVVNKAIQTSLTRMKTNAIHLLQFHWWEYDNDNYITALKHLQNLQKEGKILHLALTNFNTEHLQIIIKNNIPIVSNQVSYSIIDWRPELKMVPFCKLHNIKLLTYGTVLGGFLSNKYLGVSKPASLSTSSLSKYMRFIERWGGWTLFQELLTVLDKIAKKHGTSIANVATRYILDKPQVAGVIIGVRLGLSSHIDDNKKVFLLNLDDSDRSEIDVVAKKGKVLPGDCGDEYRS